MATETELARFRRMTDLDPEDTTYSDALLDGLIEDLGFAAAAAQVWREKAARAAALVDTTESGSSRRFSSLKDSYLAMAKTIDPGEPVLTDSAGTYTVEIERV
jgi:hypothetical protein